MCFEPTAAPPVPPRSGSLAGSERLVLEAVDGNRVAATAAATTAASTVGVVVLPDVRGLHAYYERLAEGLADAGFHAAAIDPYGRTAGAEHRGDDFDFRPHRAQATDAGLRADVRAAADHLREVRGVERVVTWGFCFGGRASFMQASQPTVDGVIGFYGWPTRGEDGGASPVEEARRGLVRVPVLAVYGGADEKITADDRAAYESALGATGVWHATVVYEGAPHSFFDRYAADHAEACADAWSRVLDLAERIGAETS